MKRTTVAGACILTLVVIGPVIGSVFAGKSDLYGLLAASSPAATTPPRGSALLAQEAAVLTRQGVPLARASRAIAVQGEVVQRDLMTKVEAAMADTYGGMWFEPAAAQVHIGVTSPASRQVAARVAARAGLASDVIETPVRSTWAQLVATQQRWNHRLAPLFARIEAQTALAPQINAVAVTLSSAVPAAERAAIEREAAAANATVTVTVLPSPRLGIALESTPTECNKFTRNEAYCNKTITSGVTIQNETNEKCTAGPMAIPIASKNETYVLTAGHCFLDPGGKFYAYNRAGTKEEIGPGPEFIFNTKADVGIIKVANPGYWAEAGETPVFADTAEWTKSTEVTFSVPVEGERKPMVGNTNCHEGQSIGQSCGVITKLDVTGGEKTTGLVEDGGGAISTKGDSGGPWMFIQTKAGTPVLMEGTHVGKSEATDNPVYEPLTKAFELLKIKLELLTTANEKR